jgi:hypothetical protein
VSKTLFSYQIFIKAEGTPNVEFLLRDAKEKSASRSISSFPPAQPHTVVAKSVSTNGAPHADRPR